MTATRSHPITRLAALIAQRHRRLSDRLHADGDMVARERGWDITVTTGRLGFVGRIYRDHRFATRAASRTAGALADQQYRSSAR